MPSYCGGFGEVVYAFGEAAPRMDVERMSSMPRGWVWLWQNG